ncbi:hypothetical protein BDF21DRAFT_465731 [Thamnidium elegans]|nr:hypothetical protein BDF21DRAFT_465731 [Thamnidium elegans]
MTTVKGTTPCKRYGHTVTLWDNFNIVFGGCIESHEYLNDVHMFDIQKQIVDLQRIQKYHNIPVRYDHSATLVGHKIYIYGSKDEHGKVVPDLYVVSLDTPPYTPDLVLKSCSMYGLWKLGLDTTERTREECNASFDIGVRNYFTTITENTKNNDEQQVSSNNLLFLGNTDSIRPKGYDHFRDALVIKDESLGLYVTPFLVQVPCEFSRLSNNSNLSDFVIVLSNNSK